MSDELSNGRRLSRREVLRRAALGGMGLAAGTLATARLSGRSQALADDSPEGFLVYAYAQRAKAMSTGDVALLAALYDPTSSVLLQFEKDRSSFMHSGLMARWNRSILLGYSSAVSLTDIQASGTTAVARLYETTQLRWISRIPEPPPPSAQGMEAWRLHPARGLPQGLGPRGEITTGIGTRHAVSLARGSAGWRLVTDAYDESDLFGTSPDLSLELWVGGPGPTNPLAGPASIGSDAPAGLGNICFYGWQAAVNYAHAHALSYNTGYCDYCSGSCGGDCANFVSQCISAGNESWNSQYWYCVQNYACNCNDSPSVAWGGSLDWVNVGGLHTWLTSTSNRGGDTSNRSDLLLGDMIGYDWYPPDGTYDHCSIVTNFDGNKNPLISCHCIDRKDYVWWDGGESGTNYRYTNLFTDYAC